MADNKLPEKYEGIGCSNCGATGAKIFKTGQVKKSMNCLTRPKTCLKCNAVTTTVETAIGCMPVVAEAPAPAPATETIPVVVAEQPPATMQTPVVVAAVPPSAAVDTVMPPAPTPLNM